MRAKASHRARAAALRIALTAGLLFAVAACHPGTPVVDTGPKPIQADGTISGTVRGPEGTTPFDRRPVEVVNVDTGARQRVLTNSAGGFTFKVKPGKYRVELTLHEGETIVKSPGEIDVNRSDVDSNADFVLGASTIARPRYHAPRSDDGLGAAVA
jgi:Carboxypeptidase regulatory-like domain